MEKIFKQKKGITLIALVITIIVLLILAGISISMLSGDNGILQRATTAKENSEKTQIEERIKLAYHAALTGGHGSYTKDSLENELENEFGENNYNVDDSDNTNWILSAKEQSVTIPAGDKEEIISARTLLTPAPTGTTYSVGDEVTLGGEKFFVLSDDGTNVKLLAKYCLSKTASTQLDKTGTYNDYGRRFSSTNYWSSISGDDLQSTAGLEKLDEQTGETTANNAILKAQEYGQTIAAATGKTVIGRLMYMSEASGIGTGTTTKIQRILYGKWTEDDATDPPTQGFLFFWLGHRYDSSYVWFVHGSGRYLDGKSYESTVYGVRPVLEI